MITHNVSDDAVVIINAKVILEDITPFQKIEIAETKEFGKVVLLNEVIQYSEKDEVFYHEPFTHPALAMCKKPEKIMIIGGGDGGTLREALKHPVKEVVLVELDEKAMNLMKEYTPIAKDAWEDPRATVIVQDALDYLDEKKGPFDVVLLDVTDPDSPSERIFTIEFLEKLKNSLSPDGVIVVQGDTERHTGRIFATASKVFKNVAAYGSFVPSFFCYAPFIIASNEELKTNFASVLEKRNIALKAFTHDQLQDLMKPSPYLKEALSQKYKATSEKDKVNWR